MATRLELQAVTKTFAAHRVLDDVSMAIGEGETLALMGPSGTGKTVLLRHLVGLMRPERGTVRVLGVDFWAQRAPEQARLRRLFGISFQEGALFDSMSVFENVAFPLRRGGGFSARQISDRVHECLSLVRLRGLERRMPAELSTGMRRRVGFARAIALKPEILLFDEPTSALDPVMTTVLNQVIQDLTSTLRCTTVVITHNLSSARALATRIALLLHGRIVADAPAAQFFELNSPEVRQFVHGWPEGPVLAAEELGAPS